MVHLMLAHPGLLHTDNLVLCQRLRSIGELSNMPAIYANFYEQFPALSKTRNGVLHCQPATRFTSKV